MSGRVSIPCLHATQVLLQCLDNIQNIQIVYKCALEQTRYSLVGVMLPAAASLNFCIVEDFASRCVFDVLWVYVITKALLCLVISYAEIP